MPTHLYENFISLSHNNVTMPDCGIGIVGRCLGPAKYFDHADVSQSITNVLCIVNIKLSIYCAEISSSHNDMTVVYLAT